MSRSTGNSVLSGAPSNALVYALAACFVWGSFSPARAETAASLLGSIRETKAAGTDSVQVSNAHKEIIVSIFTDRLSDKDRHDRAAAVAKIVAKDCAPDKSLIIFFIDSGYELKEADFTSEQLRALRSDDVSGLANLSFFTGEQAGAPVVLAGSATVTSAAASAPTPVPMSSSGGHGQYQAERAKVAARIDGLRAKGVGVQPFVQELGKIDDQYRRADVDNAIAALEELGDNLTEQEKALKELHPGDATTAASPGFSGTSKLVAGVSKVPDKPKDSRQLVALPNIGDYNNLDSFVNEMLGVTVGNLVPHSGPFLMERIQIAKRIHELETQKVNVQGYVSLFHNVDDTSVKAKKDPRLMGTLTSDIKYLQQQLGLTQMQGGIKELRNVFK